MLNEPQPQGTPVAIKDAARMSGRSESLVRTRRRSGPLVPMMLNGRQAVSLESLLQFMAERQESRQRREKERAIASSAETAFRSYLDTSQEVARLQAEGGSAAQIATAAEEYLVIARHAPTPRLRQACRRAFAAILREGT